jgi:hypothetical protein
MVEMAVLPPAELEAGLGTAPTVVISENAAADDGTQSIPCRDTTASWFAAVPNFTPNDCRTSLAADPRYGVISTKEFSCASGKYDALFDDMQ